MAITRKRNVEAAILALVPEVPARDLAEIAAHALASRSLKHAVPETAAWLSLVAYVRHNLTEYEAMLDEGYEVAAARHFALEPINAVLRGWGARRLVSAEDAAEAS